MTMRKAGTAMAILAMAVSCSAESGRVTAKCRFSNGHDAQLRSLQAKDEFSVEVAYDGGQIDRSWLRLEGGQIAEMETNGGIASMAAVGALFEELHALPPETVTTPPPCRHPTKDGIL